MSSTGQYINWASIQHFYRVVSILLYTYVRMALEPKHIQEDGAIIGEEAQPSSCMVWGDRWVTAGDSIQAHII